MLVIDLNGQSRDCDEASIDQNFPGFVSLKFTSKTHPDTQYTQWYPIDEFNKNNPELSKILGNPIPPPQSDLGVVSHAGEFYLEDTSKNWSDNIFVSYLVWISRGPGEGQVRLIKSNNKNNLTVDQAWQILPDTKSQYVISRDIHDVKILENQLPQFES